jgi:hypothetical protein
MIGFAYHLAEGFTFRTTRCFPFRKIDRIQFGLRNTSYGHRVHRPYFVKIHGRAVRKSDPGEHVLQLLCTGALHESVDNLFIAPDVQDGLAVVEGAGPKLKNDGPLIGLQDQFRRAALAHSTPLGGS